MPKKINIPMDIIAKHFHLPIDDAAQVLGACVTVLKKTCRKNGIKRWPHQRLRYIDRRIRQFMNKASLDQAGMDELDRLRKQRKDLLNDLQVELIVDAYGYATSSAQSSGPTSPFLSMRAFEPMAHPVEYVVPDIFDCLTRIRSRSSAVSQQVPTRDSLAYPYGSQFYPGSSSVLPSLSSMSMPPSRGDYPPGFSPSLRGSLSGGYMPPKAYDTLGFVPGMGVLTPSAMNAHVSLSSLAGRAAAAKPLLPGVGSMSGMSSPSAAPTLSDAELQRILNGFNTFAQQQQQLGRPMLPAGARDLSSAALQ